jgi:large subunit ribosomal protein L23
MVQKEKRDTKTGIQRGKSATTKKAVVQLAEGDTIDFYNKL